MKQSAIFWLLLGSTALSALGCGGSDDPQDGSDGDASESGGTGSIPGVGGSGGGDQASGGNSPSGGTASGGSAALDVPNYATRISAGTLYSCVIEKGGSVFCWGDSAPSLPPAGKTFTQISALLTSACGTETDGGVSCWGNSADMRQKAPAEKNFIQVAASGNAACALTTDGGVNCWGTASSDGGTGVVEGAPSTSGNQQLTRGATEVCALKSGVPSCWGFPLVDEVPATQVESHDACDGWCSIASGTLTCVGGGISSPPPGDSLAQVSVGEGNACALSQSGYAYCWGNDDLVAPANSQFVEVSTGKYHACGITVSGKVECWGTGSQATVPKDITVF